MGFSNISKNKINALYILPQSVTSLEGRFIDGNVTAYLNRVRKASNMDLEALPVMPFLEFDPFDPDIRLKERDVLEPFFKSILKIEGGEVWTTMATLSAGLAEIAERPLSWRNEKALKKISRSIQTLLEYNKTEKTSINHEVVLLSRSNIINSLNQLEKDL